MGYLSLILGDCGQSLGSGVGIGVQMREGKKRSSHSQTMSTEGRPETRGRWAFSDTPFGLNFCGVGRKTDKKCR
ncbi:MAG: hypothetical protein EA369_04810 [Bradymonadales bacterium]|nr:MAG: hypothetical protein EA369_04810 [Bradymonadales bacterium]